MAGFPKRVRIVRSSDFRKVYDRGARYACPWFAAFYLREAGQEAPRVGFTTPRALGKAVVRNRIRRRVREAVRLLLDELNPECVLVINPRRKALDAPFAELQKEIRRLFRHCNAAR